MRREGRQRGWVRAYDLDMMVDPEGKQRRLLAHTAVAGPGAAAATVANGGHVRAPRRPTNHSKPSAAGVYRELGGKGAGSSASGKGRRKFWHDEMKTYYLEMAADADVAGRFDDFYDMD